MPKNRERKEAEYYKATIRKLRKEVSNLRKQLNRNYKEVDTEEYHEEEPEEFFKKCSKCSHGLMEPVEIANRYLERCTSCGFRTPARKL